MNSDWRLVDGVTTAWFEAPSLTAGAALSSRVVELPGRTAVDLRPTGVRVRLLDTVEHADTVSAAARDLGLPADASVLQQLDIAVESSQPTQVRQFWQRVLNYAPTDDGGLTDPLRRDPGLRIRPTSEQRPLRNRLHLDVVRPAGLVEQADVGEASGPYGVCRTDTDGNEVDLVPGDPLSDSSAAADWQAVFSAMACYRTTSPAQQRDLATAAATLADDSGFPLLIDLRPGLVILDSGKDRWESDAHGLALDFTDLAGDLQAVARELGASADPELPRFVQVFLDAADVAAVRTFWLAALGYVEDPRAGVTDLYDPRRLNPVVVFQELDRSETERRRHRNRLLVELAVPSDVARDRVAAAVTAGGRLLDEAADRWRVADPEGTELVILTAPRPAAPPR